MKRILHLICLLCFCNLNAQTSEFDSFLVEVNQELGELGLPGLQLSYVAMLEAIPNLKKLAKQKAYFEQLEQRLAQIDTDKLSNSQELDYYILQFETQTQLERIEVSVAYKAEAKNITDQGLFHQPQGKALYAYFIKKWTSTSISPDDLYQFGLKEIAKVNAAIKAIQVQSGMDSVAFYKHIKSDQFYLNDARQLQQKFTEKHRQIQENLYQFYPDDQAIPPLQIKQGESARLVQTPGYYRNSTFFFNLFDYPFNLRQVDFLYMHEGIPGHHYQISYAQQLDLPAYRQFLSRSGYSEGWGAYIEDHGQDLGLYQTPYDYLGKWEWDIVRSVRVALDIGLNYYGWNNEKALQFWKKHLFFKFCKNVFFEFWKNVFFPILKKIHFDNFGKTVFPIL